MHPDSEQSAWGRSTLIESKSVRSLCVACLLVACAAAAYQGIRATRDLKWPADEDFARDVAAAETIAAGHPLSDPVYRGEWLWYNPLTPAVVAVVASIARQPIPLIYSRLGAYLNLLIPLALFALVASWWGSLRGLIAVLAALYLVPGDNPGWLTASYATSLYPMHVGQGLFYLALLAMTHAWRTGHTRAFAIAGVSLGLTLLAHTAPALLLSVAMLAEAVYAAHLEAGIGAGTMTRLRTYLVFAIAALAASAPLLVSIVGHYHLIIKNAGPGVYVLREVHFSRALELWEPVVTPSFIGLGTLVGFVELLRRRNTLEARLLLSVIVTALMLFLYGYVAQTDWAMSHGVITVVPTHHFWYYLMALTSVVFAYGVGTVAGWIGALGARWGSWPGGIERHALPILTAAVVLAAIVHYPAFARRADFQATNASTEMFTDPDLLDMYRWLRVSTQWDDVFVAPVNLGQSVIGFSGRKVVAVGKFFSNPYVDWGTRAADNLSMDQHLRANDFGGFLTISSKYRVRYIARLGPLPDAVLKQPLLSTAWHSGPWVIYKVGR